LAVTVAEAFISALAIATLAASHETLVTAFTEPVPKATRIALLLAVAWQDIAAEALKITLESDVTVAAVLTEP
jgi:hypothetical protein